MELRTKRILKFALPGLIITLGLIGDFIAYHNWHQYQLADINVFILTAMVEVAGITYITWGFACMVKRWQALVGMGVLVSVILPFEIPLNMILFQVSIVPLAFFIPFAFSVYAGVITGAVFPWLLDIDVYLYGGHLYFRRIWENPDYSFLDIKARHQLYKAGANI